MRKQTTTKAQRKRKRQRRTADQAFLDWIETLPSCLTGEYSEHLENTGEGRSIACHVRRSSAAGTALKPKFSAVPMTFRQHGLQTDKGEAACLAHYLGGIWTIEEAKAWFDQKAEFYRQLWFADNP